MGRLLIYQHLKFLALILIQWRDSENDPFFFWFSDNAAIHHSKRDIDAINPSDALLIFLPPYSPHLMPCEGVIGQAKSWIRENELVWEQCDDLEAMVFEAFMHIAYEEVVNYIHHCQYM